MQSTAKPANTNQPVVAKPSRMTLASITKGKIEAPVRVVLYGVEGIGKSTFAAGAPSPVFIGAEDGTAQLDVERFSPESWEEILEALRTLTGDSHSYRTVVIDTLDWAEPLLWDFICKRDSKTNIEDYGYSKGYDVALDEWRIFLAALDRLRKAKNMNVVLIGHSWIKLYKNPEGEDYDRYGLKLNAKAGGLVKEWADAVLFANYETYAQKEKGKRVKGVDTGARLVYTQRRAAFDAKNRYDLPDSLPLAWEDFATEIKAHRPADPAALMSEIERKAKLLGGKLEADALAAIKRANGDAAKLAQLNDWCNAQIGKKESAQ